MASVRRKYQSQLAAKDESPVASTPQVAAEPPPVAADATPPPPIETKSPAEEAGKAALRQRLQEMERAEEINREDVHQQQQPQQQQQPPAMPAAVEKWLIEHPEYTDPNDHVAQAEIYTATLKCSRDGKDWDQPDFIPTLERHLGIAPAGNGRVESKPTVQRVNDAEQRHSAPPPPAPRASTPPPRQSVPMSAPPTRDVPSMTTGRAHSHRAPLTADELQIAASSGQTPEQYQQQKERLQRLKQAGAIQ